MDKRRNTTATEWLSIVFLKSTIEKQSDAEIMCSLCETEIVLDSSNTLGFIPSRNGSDYWGQKWITLNNGDIYESSCQRPFDFLAELRKLGEANRSQLELLG
jgi:hypothetical protein